MKKLLSVLLAFAIAFVIAIPPANAQQFPGGWSKYSEPLTEEAMAIFEEATSGLLGVSYEPLAFATQIVAGTNYSYFCNATVVYPGAPSEAALVDVYAPFDDYPYVTSIQMLQHY